MEQTWSQVFYSPSSGSSVCGRFFCTTCSRWMEEHVHFVFPSLRHSGSLLAEAFPGITTCLSRSHILSSPSWWLFFQSISITASSSNRTTSPHVYKLESDSELLGTEVLSVLGSFRTDEGVFMWTFGCSREQPDLQTHNVTHSRLFGNQQLFHRLLVTRHYKKPLWSCFQ